MKKLLFLVLSALCVSNAFAQDVSAFNILWGPLYVDVGYDDNMKPTSHSFTLIFQDANYEVLDKKFVYASGSAQDIFDSLRQIEEFASKYDQNGISKSYGKTTLTRYKIPLVNYVYVDLGNESFTIEPFTINQIKKRVIKYCKKYKLELPK